MLTRDQVINERTEPMAKVATKKKKPAARKKPTIGVVEGNESGNGAAEKAFDFPPAESKKRGKAKSPERLKIEAYLKDNPDAKPAEIADALKIDIAKVRATKGAIQQASGKKSSGKRGRPAGSGKKSGGKVAKGVGALPNRGKGDTSHHHALDAAAALVKSVGGSLHDAIDYLHKLVPFSGR
jgi:hypothetical protein